MDKAIYDFLQKALGKEKLERLELSLFESTSRGIEKIMEYEPSLKNTIQSSPELKGYFHRIFRENYFKGLYNAISDYVYENRLTQEQTFLALESFEPPQIKEIEKEIKKEIRQLYLKKK
jgi:hypothetical protein